ncbi:SCOPOLETIN GLUCOSYLTRANSFERASE [Salix purpurea]|uniref:SCOPOLETIN GLUCOSYLTRANSFERASE n=1 Tax=Salix purpurea TaxID=77065 RepID=A0A9Q0VU02_SALPP|nr:SCOPOLETIN GLUCOSYLTRANSFERASE [Salix purpurea]
MSKSDFSASQLFEIAKALAASGQNFIWVVKNGEKTEGEDREEWLPEGFEKKMQGNGVAVGAQEWSRGERRILVKMEEIEHAITQLMVGEEAEGLRNRTRALKEMARRATEVEGSSYCDLNSLLGDLRAMKSTSY